MEKVLAQLLDLHKQFTELTTQTGGVVVNPTHAIVQLSAQASDYIAQQWYGALQASSKDAELLKMLKPLAKDFPAYIGKADLNKAWGLIIDALKANGYLKPAPVEPASPFVPAPANDVAPSGAALTPTMALVFHNGMLKQKHVDSTGAVHWLPVGHVSELP